MAEVNWDRQVKLIDLAWKIVDGLKYNPVDKPEAIIDIRTKYFDQAFKALHKTVSGGATSSPTNY